MVTYLEMTGMSLMEILSNLWGQFITLLPGLIGAIILLIIGYFLGILFEGIIKGALLKAGLDDWVEKHERHHALGHQSVSGILGAAAKWYIVVLFLGDAAKLINLGSLSQWLFKFAQWVPNLIAGVLLFYFGLILADMAETSILAHKYKWANFWGGVVRVFIILFVLSIALSQIGISVVIAETTYLIILAGIMLAVAIAVGMGFGYALKDESKKILKGFKK